MDDALKLLGRRLPVIRSVSRFSLIEPHNRVTRGIDGAEDFGRGRLAGERFR